MGKGAASVKDARGGVLFDLGRVVATPGAIRALGEHGADSSGLLDRHASGDWGELCVEDRKANNQAVKIGERILSSYPIGAGVKVWIITEWDRSVTTILLPEEY